MRIKSIELSWFRGAADPVLLEPDCKSMVAYGENGSGKSTFVDAVEYVLNGGRISHLAHEYSGKHQEKAIPNTHKPQGRKTELKFTFEDASERKVAIKANGSSVSSGAETAAMESWDYRRTVLRQDEVAAFIHNTKGGKYSALLPLLGLHQMEVAAENLRQLSKAIEQQSKLGSLKLNLKEVETKRKAAFGSDLDEQILEKLEGLHAGYCAGTNWTDNTLSHCDELGAALDKRVSELTSDQRRYFVLQTIAELNLENDIEAVRVANDKLSDSVEPLINESLQVLHSTRTYVDKLTDETEVNCPACGRSIPVPALQAHVKQERERLQEIIHTFDTRKGAVGTLCDSIRSLKLSLGKVDLKDWRDEIGKKLISNLEFLDGLNTEHIRASCGTEDLINIEDNLQPLIKGAALASRMAPADVKQLTRDKQTVAVGRAVIAAKDQVATVARIEELIAFINELETGIRGEIRHRSQKVIGEISEDIRSMWQVLHPGKAIEEVSLYLPKDSDKAIDISLKFYGVAQDSPRLTLSEGYRNSLGLCIFLAMAKREANTDRPLFLDDVTVSLDRNHRGMIVELLEKEFGGRQVILLTHDREWYTELRQQLNAKDWMFKALLPYETPDIGIRWSHKTTTFDDARAHLKERPDSAGNDSRKIMDVELSLIAERLKISLQYRRADKNDKRMAHEFLERLVADGQKCLEKKGASGYVTHADAIDAFDHADKLLLSWGNRASHSFDVVRPEATKLIDACEKAIESFKCSSCGKGVWFADTASSKWMQCQCGEIRWRYGKL